MGVWGSEIGTQEAHQPRREHPWPRDDEGQGVLPWFVEALEVGLEIAKNGLRPDKGKQRHGECIPSGL